MKLSSQTQTSEPRAAAIPYVNTILNCPEVEYQGDAELELRVENLTRWNALWMVIQANQGDDGLGGHIATYASCATLYEVGLSHFFRGGEDGDPDIIYWQPHSAPGIYARAFLEYRLDEQHLQNFRRELAGGLSSYPHPHSMPEFWQTASASMGLSAIQSIYQARLTHYLHNRNLTTETNPRVWCFLGDGEMDEPEATGGASRGHIPTFNNLID